MSAALLAAGLSWRFPGLPRGEGDHLHRDRLTVSSGACASANAAAPHGGRRRNVVNGAVGDLLWCGRGARPKKGCAQAGAAKEWWAGARRVKAHREQASRSCAAEDGTGAQGRAARGAGGSRVPAHSTTAARQIKAPTMGVRHCSCALHQEHHRRLPDREAPQKGLSAFRTEARWRDRATARHVIDLAQCKGDAGTQAWRSPRRDGVSHSW